MRRWLLAVALALPLAAQAQDHGTRLTLAETGSALRLPDTPVASMRAEARATTAAAAQQQLNRTMTAALEEARELAGLTPATGRYSVQRGEENRTWLATQLLTLRGGDPAALADLIGTLQSRGLALDDLGWRLSDAQQREARDEATRQGLAAVNQRAALVAGELGLTVQRIERVALDVALDLPAPRMASAMAARAAPPVAVPHEVAVTVRITAEILLTARQDP